MSDEERKRMQGVTEWLNSDEGYLWARGEFEPVKYGRTDMFTDSPFGLYSLKYLDGRDVSGSPGDFTAAMWWGCVPGDDRLREEYEKNGEPAGQLVY